VVECFDYDMISTSVVGRKAREAPPCINICNLCPNEVVEELLIVVEEFIENYCRIEKLRVVEEKFVNALLNEYNRGRLLPDL
jgi:hypothetical protein